ncbi:ANT(4')-I family aminoglycoside nucleotidyltransferase [Paenibacillus tarimensis]
MYNNGPNPISRSERMEICREITGRLHEVYGNKIKAIGVYGSVARGTDGPYSDIEMFCVQHQSGLPVEECYEWSAGSWKAEVDIYSADLLLAKAAIVERRWPLTHGPYFNVLSLYDPDSFFPALKMAAEAPEKSSFSVAINEVLVGEMYEFIGKLRNANQGGPQTYLPYLAVQLAQNGAMLIGLHNRKTYSTGAMVLPEAVTLPDRPDGYDRVAELVMSGQLAEPPMIVSACERYWNGLVKWAEEYDYVIHSKRLPF